ncbi:MAG: RNA polymerase factor sigma-32 [Desulfuromonadaceae bacterium]|nr:RNA polymerase factor sigma-32 [Desulfuromonadaceae bacterium]
MVANYPVASDSLTLYLAEIRQFKILSEDEERFHAVKLFEGKNLESAHTLITSNLRYVVKVASEYRHYGLKMLDLIQEGNIGLMVAVRKFNPYKGVRLISYAVWWIRAYIQNYILSAWSLVKIGTTQAQRKLFYGLRKAKEKLIQMTGHEPDIAGTAQMLQVSGQDVTDMEQRMKREVSLDDHVGMSDDITLLETIADERMNQEELLAAYQREQDLKLLLNNALEGLTTKERFIIEHRVACDTPLTLQDIADHFQISRERIRQIEERALLKLRSLIPKELVYCG